MSIWCSWEPVGWDHWPDDHLTPIGGEVRTYAAGWSNHYPTTDDTAELPAAVDLAHVAAHCVPGHAESEPDYPEVGPWLRLGLGAKAQRSFWKSGPEREPMHATVVMDEAAVTALRDQLTNWLDLPKVQPQEETP